MGSAVLAGPGVLFAVATTKDQMANKAIKITGQQVYQGNSMSGSAAAAKASALGKTVTVNSTSTTTATVTLDSLTINSTYYVYAVASNGAPQYPALGAVKALNKGAGIKADFKPAPIPPKKSNAKILYSGFVAFFAILLSAIINF